MPNDAPSRIRVINIESRRDESGADYVNGDVLFHFTPDDRLLRAEVSVEADCSQSIEQIEARLVEHAVHILKASAALPPESIADLRLKGRSAPDPEQAFPPLSLPR